MSCSGGVDSALWNGARPPNARGFDSKSLSDILLLLRKSIRHHLHHSLPALRGKPSLAPSAYRLSFSARRSRSWAHLLRPITNGTADGPVVDTSGIDIPTRWSVCSRISYCSFDETVICVIDFICTIHQLIIFQPELF